MTEKRRKPKSSGPRTEVFAMRLDPKMKYLAEVAARKQRRSLANFLEWAIELGLKHTPLGPEFEGAPSIWDKSGTLWDVSEVDRFVKLVYAAPDLMTYDEQILWKMIRKAAPYWKGCNDLDGDSKWQGRDERDLNLERLRRDWEILKKCASGQAEVLDNDPDNPNSSS